METARQGALLALLTAWTWASTGVAAATAPVRGVTAWPGLLGGVVANVHVSHPGRSGHQVPAGGGGDDADLTTAAQTYAHYDHYDTRAPHQPVSVYQEFRLQQHHPPSAQYTTPPDAVADTTTFAPASYSVQAAAVPHPALQQTSQSPTSAAPLDAPHPRPSAKSLGHADSSLLHHELQMQLSQQIQVQLEQLQKLHELQHKMLKVPKEAAPPVQQAVQQGSELVNRHVPHPDLQHQGAPQEHNIHPAAQPEKHSHLQHHLHHHHQQAATAASPVVYAATATPPPPPTEPRYPEESQPLQSFIGETTSPPAPVGGALSNGFQPILPPAGRHPPDAQHPGADADPTDFQPSFQPFTEDATDPALPFYLLPPAEDSDSQFNSLREVADPPAAELGDADIHDESSSASTEHLDVAQAYRRPVVCLLSALCGAALAGDAPTKKEKRGAIHGNLHATSYDFGGSSLGGSSLGLGAGAYSSGGAAYSSGATAYSGGHVGSYQASYTVPTRHTYSQRDEHVSYPVPQAVPVTVDRHVPVPVPQPVPVEQPRAVPVPVPQPYPVNVPRAVPVDVPRPVAVPVPVPQPYKVPVPQPYNVPVPHPVTVNQAVPVPVPVPQPTIYHAPAQVYTAAAPTFYSAAPATFHSASYAPASFHSASYAPSFSSESFHTAPAAYSAASYGSSYGYGAHKLF
ncbi:Zinc finger protein 512B [Frankliniella fusca]|uniref:Zinc finger protein 512B n=1 Tax=Frankliniella fusca TaxID=407009 RepID=A0AAE1LCJ8_9NEOP|nr:Zinc finger protein 512B [Frankliniella fusca]